MLCPSAFPLAAELRFRHARYSNLLYITNKMPCANHLCASHSRMDAGKCSSRESYVTLNEHTLQRALHPPMPCTVSSLGSMLVPRPLHMYLNELNLILSSCVVRKIQHRASRHVAHRRRLHTFLHLKGQLGDQPRTSKRDLCSSEESGKGDSEAAVIRVLGTLLPVYLGAMLILHRHVMTHPG